MILAKNTDGSFKNTVILPFFENEIAPAKLPAWAADVVAAAIAEERFKAAKNEVLTLNCINGGKIANVILVGLGARTGSNREIFMAYCEGFKTALALKATEVTVVLENLKNLAQNEALYIKMCEAPILVAYNFAAYRTGEAKPAYTTVEFVTDDAGFEKILAEGKTVAESTVLARDLVNHPSCYMTPAQMAEEAKKIADETGIELEIFEEKAIKDMKMESFWAVAKGAPSTPPKLIVLRYRGAGSDKPTIGLVGKGIMFDSGGYSLKNNDGMMTMNGDMGGAAAVFGAIRTAALMKLPVNAVAVVAACENKIGDNAQVPGDIIGSMNGKTIAVLNTDAEGRLALADAITYAIRKENCDKIVDIATLTGAAKMAVGNRSAATLTNDDDFYALLKTASQNSCEKVWQLDLDKELLAHLTSGMADIKNSVPGSSFGGGTITGGLFISEFVEGKPWIHVDCAPVNMTSENLSYAPNGATGYGAALLYNFLKLVK